MSFRSFISSNIEGDDCIVARKFYASTEESCRQCQTIHHEFVLMVKKSFSFCLRLKNNLLASTDEHVITNLPAFGMQTASRLLGLQQHYHDVNRTVFNDDNRLKGVIARHASFSLSVNASRTRGIDTTSPSNSQSSSSDPLSSSRRNLLLECRTIASTTVNILELVTGHSKPPVDVSKWQLFKVPCSREGDNELNLFLHLLPSLHLRSHGLQQKLSQSEEVS